MASHMLPDSPASISSRGVQCETSISASLCTQCQSIISGDTSRFEAFDGLDCPCFSHHDTFASFQVAITSGCYICVRIRDRLDQGSFDLFSLSESSKEISTSEAAFTTYTVTEHNDGSAQIHIHFRKNHAQYLFCDFGLYNSMGSHAKKPFRTQLIAQYRIHFSGDSTTTYILAERSKFAFMAQYLHFRPSRSCHLQCSQRSRVYARTHRRDRNGRKYTNVETPGTKERCRYHPKIYNS
jgi:hypothetical protein